MKKFVFAGDWVLGQMVGVQRYAYQLLSVLDRWMGEGKIKLEIELLVPSNASWLPKFSNIKIIKKGYIRNKIEKHMWQQVIFPIYVRRMARIGVDLTAAFPIWGCDIYAIHDCIPEVFPENFIDHNIFRQITIAKKKLITSRNKKRFVTLTNDSLREVQKYYHIEDNRIDIVSCGWEHMIHINEDDLILKKLGLENGCEYFFSLGSKYKHKNYQWVLATAKKNPKYKFVLTGTNSFSDSENELKENSPSNVIFTGYITNEEIKSLMMHCKALIQPSIYEGFGLPPLEALSLGTSIIISDTSCLPEIYKETAYYINPYDYDVDLDELMNCSVNTFSKVLNEYTWDRAALQLLKVLEKERNI